MDWTCDCFVEGASLNEGGRGEGAREREGGMIFTFALSLHASKSLRCKRVRGAMGKNSVQCNRLFHVAPAS